MEINLRTIRKAKGLTQKELADKTGLSRISIARYETGANRPSAVSLFKLTKALECSAEEIMMQKAG